MNFCKMCGTSLAPRPAPAGAPAWAEATAAAPAQALQNMVTAGKATCPSCQQLTPSGFAFCQHCGSRLGAVPAPTAPMAEATMPTLAAAAMAQTGGVRNATAYAPTMFHPTPVPGMPTARPTTGGLVQEGARQETITSPHAVQRGRLVVLRSDGSDGESHAITSDVFDVGRTEGELVFGDDPFLAYRHARFYSAEGSLRVCAIDTINGVYLRLREPHELKPGDQFLLGRELLRFEPVAPEERDPPSLVEHGVRLFGSAQREAWARLRELTGAGTTRNLWYLTRPEFVLGREEGDVVFPSDEYMSRRHALLRRGSGTARARLEDLGSSNGTFVRLSGECTLQSGDVLRMGDQLLRFEN